MLLIPITLETEPHAGLGCSAVSHYKPAYVQLNAAKRQPDHIPMVASAQGEGSGRRAATHVQQPGRPPARRLRSGEVLQQHGAHFLSVVSPCISASSQPSRTAEQRISAPPTSGPSILWRRHWMDIKMRVMASSVCVLRQEDGERGLLYTCSHRWQPSL